MKNLIYLIVVLASLSSCTQDVAEENKAKYSDEIERIDKLSVQLDEAEEVFMDVDTTKAKKAAQAYAKNVQLLGRHYKPEKVDSSFGQLMSGYKALKGGSGLYQSRSKARQGLRFTRKNLKALKENIIAGKFSDEEIKKYLDDESKAVHELTTTMKTTSQAAKHAVTAYDSLNPKVEKYVQELMDSLEVKPE